MTSSSASATATALTNAITATVSSNPLVCLESCDILPIQKLVKSHSNHANGSKYQVNSADAKSCEHKSSYQVPTCFGPIKVKTSQVKRAERSTQVKASQASASSSSIHHKLGLL
ncbi:hypothetical protein I4U23_017313 [Adineta vaga]|nr:hypothetical protein I4U23_017313 [Adineta vaga]